MRALLAAVLTLGLVLTAAAPHVHVAGRDESNCAACVVRRGDVARKETPDAGLLPLPAAAPQLEPLSVSASGAPLGAIPGQSPPAGV